MNNAFTALRAGATETVAKVIAVAPTSNEKKLRLIVSFDGKDRQVCYIFRETWSLANVKANSQCLFILEPSKDGQFMNVIAISEV